MPSDPKWWHRTLFTLVPDGTHNFLNRCWLSISEAHWYSTESNWYPYQLYEWGFIILIILSVHLDVRYYQWESVSTCTISCDSCLDCVVADCTACRWKQISVRPMHTPAMVCRQQYITEYVEIELELYPTEMNTLALVWCGYVGMSV